MKSDDNLSQGPTSQQPIEDENESIYDQFAEIKFENQIIQKCWLVLGQIFYSFDVTDFLQPVTEELYGKEWYEEYCSVILTPMDISTMIERMKSKYYLDENDNEAWGAKNMFIDDMLLIFTNCKTFN